MPVRKPFGARRTSSCSEPMPSMATRTLQLTSRASQSFTMWVSMGTARSGVNPVVLNPILRRLGSLSRMTRESSIRSSRVVGSPPEMWTFSIRRQNGEAKTRSISSIVMSGFRRPRFQLPHISHSASQTKVQLKMRTVG